MISWHIVTSEVYRLGDKVEGDLYFLSDTHEIMRGSQSFSEACTLYTEEPTVKAVGRLYINSTTLEGKVWNGTAWSTVIRPVDATVTAEGVNPVSGKAVVDYVKEALAALPTTAVTDITWDKTEHILSVHKGESKTDIVLSGVAVNMSANTQDKKTLLQLLDASGEPVGNAVSLDLERFVTGGEYDPEKKVIVLYFDGKTGEESTDKVEIPVADLVDTYTVKSGTTLTLSMSGTEITGEVKASAEEGNAIVVKADGIYVPVVDVSSKMELVPEATEGNIASFGTGGQVVDSGVKMSDIAAQGKANVFQGTTTPEEAVGEGTAAQGDICIIKKAIAGTENKFEYTAYVYDKNAWVAMDGNYNAENVYFDKDLITTSAIGNITLTNGQATIAAAGKNLKQVFDTIFVKEKSPSITQPSVSISAPQNKAYEVGTPVTPSFTATLNPGKYEYGPVTGITAKSWSVSDNAEHTSDKNSGSFDAFTVGDDTNYKITATATYDDGAIPVTNVGNEYAAGQIKAGNKTGTSAAITGFRCGFYGTLTSKDGEINSALVRSLATKTTSAPAQGNTWSLAVPKGALRIVFAYPATIRDVNSVLDVNGMNAEIKTAFTLHNIDVEGANGYTAKPYKVYVMDLAAANDTANTYTVKL